MMNKKSNRRLFKKLTPENWSQRDDTLDLFTGIKIDGSQSVISNDQWASMILRVELDSSVPEDVRDLFEVAQGILCYGCYFYPLYTLGHEQMFRVLEAAVCAKYVALEAPTKCKSLFARLGWLKDTGHISEALYGMLNAARNLRNSASHAKAQKLVLPMDAVATVEQTADLIIQLFAANSPGLKDNSMSDEESHGS